MPRKVPENAWRSYVLARERGADRDFAAKRNQIDYAAACAFDRGDPRSSGIAIWNELCKGRPLWEAAVKDHARLTTGGNNHTRDAALELGRERTAEQLKAGRDGWSDAARAAFDDPTGALWRTRYFGRVVLPWHNMTWAPVRELYYEGRNTGDRKFALINVPPGAGKTTLFHDFECWAITDDRNHRIGNFSVASKVSVGNTARVRNTLARPDPKRATELELARGWAINAEATLAGDFGAYKPLERDMWQREQFIVARHDGEATDDKEPTCAAWGFDQAYIGQRLSLIVADDMVDKRFTRNPEVLDNQIQTWDDETETRLDPGGLLILVGQRLSADDLYAYCERQTVPIDPDDIDDIDLIDGMVEPKRYFHLKFPAHDDENCRGLHRRSEAKPWPEGCLLDPARLGYTHLMGVKAKNATRYYTVFQQSDQAPGESLVEQLYLDGGVSADGAIYPGCFDDDRSVWHRPQLDQLDGIGVITVDPSSTKWWAVQAWWYQQPIDPAARAAYGGRRYLLGLENTKLDAPSLLGLNIDTGAYFGVLEDMRQRYLAMGMPLDYVVIEANHAQRFLLQQQLALRWAEMHTIQLVAHQTYVDKWDENVGVTILSEQYKTGRVRIPNQTSLDREHVKPLLKQLTTWGRATVTDQVMANWFLEKKLPQLPIPDRVGVPTGRASRPAWLLRQHARTRR